MDSKKISKVGEFLMNSYRILFLLISLFLFTNSSYAEVRVNGEIVVKNSYGSAYFLGEIINDTSTPIKNVQVSFTFKDSTDALIDTETSYISGYNVPGDPFNNTTYIPAGGIAPFRFYTDADSSEIASYSYTINYENTDTVPVNPDLISIPDGLSFVDDYGINYYGEILNNSTNVIYFVKITVVSKDFSGKILDIDYSYVSGDDYLALDAIHTDTMIHPSGFAPFNILTSIKSENLASTYYIINYDTGETGNYSYDDNENVFLEGSLNKIEGSYGVRYLGAVKNNTEKDIYFVKVTVVSKNKDNEIIDISYDYVQGGNYTYYSDFTTDTYISPNSSAPFEIETFLSDEDINSFYYKINYQFKESTSLVQENELNNRPFMIKQNYPNPFNQSTTIDFFVSKEDKFDIEIYNISGQKVETISSKKYSLGNHSIKWDARNLPSGVYFLSFHSGNYTETKKLTLLK